MTNLPLGKIPPDLLDQIFRENQITDPRVHVGPGVGLDCAVIDMGDRYLVLKSDPITFTSDEIGWYAVQINANDIATTGATPRWFLATLLLPEGRTRGEDVHQISQQIGKACRSLGVNLIGGHTEVTHGLDRPIIAGTMIGEVPHDGLITPEGARPGDTIFLTKSVPIEGTAILARERPEALAGVLSSEELLEARNYIHQPGLGVVRDARIAAATGGVTAMHDPTEGGLASALWELAEACGHRLQIDLGQVPVTDLSEKICRALQIDPFQAIASGALLLTSAPEKGEEIQHALTQDGISCQAIGRVVAGPAEVVTRSESGWMRLDRPQQDAVARVLET